MAFTIRAYAALPLTLVAVAMFHQLGLIPNVLKIERKNYIDTVQEAYGTLESIWTIKNSDMEVSDVREFIKVPNFLAKSSYHKVKVIIFSKTGEHPTPFIRQAAKDYWAYASFAFILWREEESSYWWGIFGVESAPSIVLLKEPGVNPIVHHGSVNDSFLLNMLENSKQQELPQLRSVTSMELGCDARGYSRAGYDTNIWYCVIAAGRPSLQLNIIRATMCRVQQTLFKHSEADDQSFENQSLAPALDAFRGKRLTFAWLDGEKQKDYCQFYLGRMNYYTCGKWTGLTDIPQIFIIRYLRNNSGVDKRTQEMTRSKSSLQDLIVDSDQAGQLWDGYFGEVDISQVIDWLANKIKDGDSSDLPFVMRPTPKLVPDDTEPVWSKTSPIDHLENLKQSVRGVLSGLSIYLEYPRIGPGLIVVALISFGTIWLQRSKRVQPSQPNQPSQPSS